MDIDIKGTSQFELFPHSSSPRSSSEKFRYHLTSITVSPDNLVVVCIVSIMTFVFFFAVGVERGKTVGLAKAEAEAGKSNPLQNQESEIISPSVQPASGGLETLPVAMGQLKTAPTAKKQEVIDIQKLKNEVQPAQTAGNHFTIQVASFKQQQNAQKEADTLKKVGYETFVVAKGTHAIVCVGRFLEKTEALSFSKKLQSKYGDTLVRRL